MSRRAYIQCAQCEVVEHVSSVSDQVLIPAELLVILFTKQTDGKDGVAVITRKLEGE